MTGIDLPPLTTPRQMLDELDSITDRARELTAYTVRQKKALDLNTELVARLERLADHLEAFHGLEHADAEEVQAEEVTADEPADD